MRIANRYHRGLVISTLIATLALGVTACGSTSATSPAGSGQLSSSKMTTLQSAVTTAEGIPSFTAPGPSFDASPANGKTVVAVPLSSQIPYCAGIIQDMVPIGKQLGVTVTNYTSSGQPSDWEAAATLAYSEHASAFTTICGIDPSSLGPQISKLNSATIPTVALLGDVSLSVPSDVAGGASIQLNLAADLLDDLAIVNNAGKPFDALVLTDYEIYGAHSPTNEAVAHFKSSYGNSFNAQVMSIPQSDWSSAVGGTVSTELTRDPKITAIIVLYDGMVPGMVSAVENAHRTGLKIYTYGASAGVVDLINSTHGMVAADIGASTDWTAYSQMDQVLRVMTGQPAAPYKDEYPPLRLWDTTNYSDFNGADPYGTAYAADYDQLWGVK
jgi:ribose transport system substrate-binding protein